MSKYDKEIGSRMVRIGRVFSDLERSAERLDNAKRNLPRDGALRAIADRLADHGDMYVVDSFLVILDRAISQVAVAARDVDQAAQAIELEAKT